LKFVKNQNHKIVERKKVMKMAMLKSERVINFLCVDRQRRAGTASAHLVIEVGGHLRKNFPPPFSYIEKLKIRSIFWYI